jgi:hypothetical protein
MFGNTRPIRELSSRALNTLIIFSSKNSPEFNLTVKASQSLAVYILKIVYDIQRRITSISICRKIKKRIHYIIYPCATSYWKGRDDRH